MMDSLTIELWKVHKRGKNKEFKEWLRGRNHYASAVVFNDKDGLRIYGCQARCSGRNLFTGGLRNTVSSRLSGTLKSHKDKRWFPYVETVTIMIASDIDEFNDCGRLWWGFAQRPGAERRYAVPVE